MLNKIPTVSGVSITRAPGAIIFLRDAEVEISIQRFESGLYPFYIPKCYLLISIIISLAASPTALIVSAEKA